ncbi:hypothetical protein ACEPAF_2006 [Sanghuangporus sanghuang]
MKLATFTITLCALSAAALVTASTFPIVAHSRSSIPNVLGKRSVDIGAFGNGSELVTSDGADTSYFTNLTLGGKEFQVIIDTGSSDLWVIGDVPGAKNLSIESGVNYAEGSAEGFISTADLEFDNYVVKDQAFISVIPTADTPDVQGLIGLGPSSASQVRKQMKSSAGAPPLDRIFRQNTSTPNFLSVLLTRQEDNLPEGTAPQSGQLTVGSVIPTLGDITKQKKLPALVDQFGVQHWQTLLDENGIIGPDGKPIPTNTSISDPEQGTEQQFHVMLDTGFTFPQVPRQVADALYGRVPDAEFVPQSDTPGYWRVPCDYELNITFVFDGVKYPIHPLDMTLEEPDSEATGMCQATFQQISPTITNNHAIGAIDAILGMAFLRNTYLLIDFGDFVDGSNSSVADPYIQLLSITDLSAAHIDFVNARLGGVDTTDSQSALLSEADAKHSPETPGSKSADTDSIKSDLQRVGDKIKKAFYKTAWFIAVVAVAGALLLALVAWCLLSRCRRRRSNVRMEPAFTPAMAGAGAYAPLRDTRSRPQQGHYTQPSYDASVYQSGGYHSSQYAEPRYNYAGRTV